MLVLSRRLGESVVIDDEAIATVAVIGREFVELSLTRLDGSLLGTSTIGLKKSSPVFAGVRGVVARFENEKVRFGFDGPEGSRVDRGEEWEARRQF
jgi:sRNA-binding carbon storage regulator CsrA